MPSMNLNSRLFDRIRVRRPPQQPPRTDAHVGCAHPGCALPGEFRAPMGRQREGQYYSFCLDHVREYNASYNYFTGMSDDAVARYQREAMVGHRPTWTMGVNRADKGRPEDAAGSAAYDDPLGVFGSRAPHARPAEAPRPRYGVASTRALETLGLDDQADAATVRTRYKDLVKRLHPDANGGDRSSEDKLRQIIQAYKTLKAARIA